MNIDDCKTLEEFEQALAEYVERLKNEPCDELESNDVLDEINKLVSTTKEDAPKFYIKKRH